MKTSRLPDPPYNSEFKIPKEYDWIPWLSEVSGVARVLFGGYQCIWSFGKAEETKKQPVILQLFSHHTQSSIWSDGLSNIGRGLIATVPFAGNLTLYLYDTNQATKEELLWVFMRVNDVVVAWKKLQ